MRTKTDKQQIEYVQLSALTPYARNSRTHSPEQVKRIAASIREFGFTNPVLIDADGTIIAGHGRVLAAQHLQMDTVPVVRLEYMTEQQKRAYVIADNRLALDAGWDEELLRVELDTLHADGYDVAMTGFGADELAELMKLDIADKQETDEDEVPEPPAEPTCKTGDIWQLGAHRLMCGDSTNAEHVQALMNGSKARIVFTDPPYDLPDNINVHSIIDAACDDAHVFLMHDDRGIVNYLRQSTFKFRQFFVANFQFSSPRGNDPYLQHILVSHESKGNAQKHNNMHDGFASIIKMQYRHTLKDEQTEHKHQKPIDFVCKFIEHYSSAGMIAFEPFAGSGTTIIAAEQLQRACFAMEISPAYCDVIIARWEKYTGLKAHKL